ncbi:two-component system response regulator [Marivirga tractuosa]|uniref:Response regulator receiver protein n=1 Tax=Marivirga tractuosa (strain ATCC 23168 / DSM 4126 / NBRC 15989 / NCIMB 1408 / VKM B-1430 / H-43) TaxID=643867 RepID=E4TPX6_MARTH|nr:response regulator [Marivirga tractuosa]ADR20533.1 response regulator receiver protein [Marivirga tractuosa DSM 4126]BDD15019.1 two-component system response regulator [Marivirga tractuosa]
MDTLNILLVEDNESDILITQEILNQRSGLTILNSVTSAEEAILYLSKRGPFLFAEKPEVILLDLNLPKSDGFAVLVEVKSTTELMDIPVIILTSSSCDYDKEFAMKNGADLYLEKPLELHVMDQFLTERKANEDILLLNANHHKDFFCRPLS